MWLTCGQHDGGVAVVGAADDGGHHHGAVAELEVPAVVHEGDGSRLLLLGDVEALEAHLKMRKLHQRHLPERPAGLRQGFSTWEP